MSNPGILSTLVTMSEQDSIDLQKFTQKELLIITYQRVLELTTQIKDMSGRQEAQEVRISIIETKVKLWAAMIGGAAALVVEIIINLSK
jgi:hypothetical protein